MKIDNSCQKGGSSNPTEPLWIRPCSTYIGGSGLAINGLSFSG